MSLKTEILRICGNCKFADQRLEFHEFPNSKKEAYLIWLRRHSNSTNHAETLCQREHINVKIVDEACAFWKPHTKQQNKHILTNMPTSLDANSFPLLSIQLPSNYFTTYKNQKKKSNEQYSRNSPKLILNQNHSRNPQILNHCEKILYT